MLTGIEQAILAQRPDWVLVYGDTNSTLAGALAAAKLHIPVAHVEAGLRSFNRHMPEEINRVVADHLSTLLLCPTHAAVRNLEREGIQRGVVHVGDVRYDAALAAAATARERSEVLHRLGVSPGGYLLATVHRAENTDDPVRLGAILAALAEVSARAWPVVLPMHPRTRKALAGMGAETRELAERSLRLIDPVSYLDMTMLELSAKAIVTDSGGVQKEAYFHRVPCLTLRGETEWVETVETGWNRLVNPRAGEICAALTQPRPTATIPEYGEGHAAEKVARLLRDGSPVASGPESQR
jgi:UDP-GlcNAc3NAcA epimerase